jgi:mandelate racemase
VITPPIPELRLQIRSVQAHAVSVPRRKALALGGGITNSAFVIVEVATEQGITGMSCAYCALPLAQKPLVEFLKAMDEPLRGASALPAVLKENLTSRFRLFGTQGVAGLVVSALDNAAWDALAKAAGLPLVRLLGGEPKPISAYATFGIGLLGAERTAEGAARLVEDGFRAVKVRLGYEDPGTEVALIRAVRQAVGPEVRMLCDYNQSLSVQEAIARGRLLDEEGMTWIEEPVAATDDAGMARVARELNTPIQAGENYWSPQEMNRALCAGAFDCVMPDVSRIGGVTGWMQCAAIAAANGIPISSHLMPEISAHLLSVAANRHWLEYVDWLNPILRSPLRIDAGAAIPGDAAGTGLEFDEDAVRSFLVP